MGHKALLIKKLAKTLIKVHFLAAIFKNGCHGGHVGYFVGVSFFF